MVECVIPLKAEGINGSLVNRPVRRAWGLAAMILLASLTATGCDKLSALTSSGEKPATTPPPPQTSALPKPPVSPSEVLAVVNNRAISQRDAELVLQNIKAASDASGRTWTSLKEDDLKQLLDGLIVAELKAQEAVARGLDRDHDVQNRLLFLARSFYAQEWERRQLDRSPVSQSDIEAFYKTNELYFQEPEQIKIRQLVVGTEDQVKDALVQLLQGADFIKLAEQMSLRPEAVKPATVDKWVMRSKDKSLRAPNDDEIRSVPDLMMEQAAFAIDKPGSVSTYVKGPDGKFHIFQLVDRKKASQRPLTDPAVSTVIRGQLLRQKIDEAVQELQSKAKVDRFPERLQGIKQP